MSVLVGREELLSSLWSALQQSSVLLSGPRRIGKSRLLATMAEEPRHGFRLVRADVEGFSDVASVLASVQAKLSPPTAIDRATSRISVNAIEVAGVGVRMGSAPAGSDPWAEFNTHLRAAIQPNETLVIALDEVPWWLDALERRSPGSAREALARLRGCRQELRAVRWVLTGSVGLAGPAQAWGAVAELNDLHRVVVQPLDAIAGATLFEAECPTATADAARAAHHVAGGSPHWIESLAIGCRSAAPTVDATHVEAEVERKLQAVFRELFADDHADRRYTAEDRSLQRLVLDAMCDRDDPYPIVGVVTTVLANPKANNDKDAIRRALYALLDDFVLIERPGSTARFAIPLYRRWWARWGRS